jgi:hypothetical protein
MAHSFNNLIKPSTLWAEEVTNRVKALEDAPPGIFGALVYGSEFQSIANSSNTIVEDWDTVVYDDLGFFNIIQPDILTIPDTDPVIERVQIYYQYSWQPNVTGIRSFFIEQTDIGNIRGGIADAGIQTQAAAPLLQTAYSMPIPCVPGDYFRIITRQESGIALLLGLQGFGITVAK